MLSFIAYVYYYKYVESCWKKPNIHRFAHRVKK